MLVAWRGLSLGKWLSTAGAFTTVFVSGVVILAAVPRWFDGSWGTLLIALSAPAVSLLNINSLDKMGLGGLCGVDSVAVFAGEWRSKNVAGAIRKSVGISAPVIATMMILRTTSVLTFSRPKAIDLLMPPIQVISLAAPRFAGIAAGLIVLMLVTGRCLCFSVLSRFPIVAGWDHILPEWFNRLDPRYQTPAGSVVFAIPLGAPAGETDQQL